MCKLTDVCFGIESVLLPELRRYATMVVLLLSLYAFSCGEHMKLQSFRCSSANITDAHAPLALLSWSWPLTASSCRLAACFLWSLTAQSEQVPLLLILQLFLPIFLILGWVKLPHSSRRWGPDLSLVS